MIQDEKKITLELPSKKMLFLKPTNLEIPSKLRMNQKIEFLIPNKTKHIIEDVNGRVLFNIIKSPNENFTLTDCNKNPLYKFTIKNNKKDILNFVITNLKEKEEKIIEIEREPSTYRVIYKIKFWNEGTNDNEFLYLYFTDSKTEIFFGKRKTEGGNLIFEAQRTHETKTNYALEFAPGVDKIFVFTLFQSLTCYAQSRSFNKASAPLFNIHY